MSDQVSSNVLLDNIFDNAADLAPEARAAFVEEACKGDIDLQGKVMRLLGQMDAADNTGFLDSPLIPEGVLNNFGDPKKASTPRQIGPYRLIRSIGRGGMGKVYLARRNDEEFSQFVAIKVMRKDLDTGDIQHRFRIERQILAAMSHSNIAKLLDGGSTPDGLSYFVMEFVDGIPITNYCDDHKLDVRQRLMMFQNVCKAVHYAHQNLVVHRDLKPSNILVTPGGEVKLLDFGIAKVLNPTLIGLEEAFTQNIGLLLTPAYASPEQVTGAPITTASDIYSLGVVLYELLVGARPLEFSNKSPVEIEETLRNSLPEKPSALLSKETGTHTIEGGPDTSQAVIIGKKRALSPDRLYRTLRGDLDSIVLKALRKEADRRYTSAEKFMEDIDNYLNRLPVQARKGSIVYQTDRFVRRHKVAVAATIGTLALSSIFSAILFVQNQKNLEEKDRALAVSHFLTGLFEEFDPNQAADQQIKIEDVLDKGVVRIEEEMKDQPMVAAELNLKIGNIYRKAAQYDKAEKQLRESLAVFVEQLGPSHETTADTYHELGWTLYQSGERSESKTLLKKAVDVYSALTEDMPEEKLARALMDHGYSLQEQGAYDEAEEEMKEALDLMRKHYGPNNSEVALAVNRLAFLHYERRNFTEAEHLYRSALLVQRQILDEPHGDIAQTLHNLGSLLAAKEEYENARVYYEQALEMRQAIYGEVHPSVALTANGYSFLLQRIGDMEMAEEMASMALDIRRKIYGNGNPIIALSLNSTAWILQSKGDFETAEKQYREAIEIYRGSGESKSPRLATALIALGQMLSKTNEMDEAHDVIEEARVIRSEHYGPEDRRTLLVRSMLSRVLISLGREEEARRVIIDLLEILRVSFPEDAMTKNLETRLAGLNQ